MARRKSESSRASGSSRDDRHRDGVDLRPALFPDEADRGDALRLHVDRHVDRRREDAALADLFGGDPRGRQVRYAAALELEPRVRDVELRRQDRNPGGADLPDRPPHEGRHDLEVVDHEVEHHVDVEAPRGEDAEAVHLDEPGRVDEGERRFDRRVVALDVPDLEDSPRLLAPAPPGRRPRADSRSSASRRARGDRGPGRSAPPRRARPWGSRRRPPRPAARPRPGRRGPEARIRPRPRRPGRDGGRERRRPGIPRATPRPARGGAPGGPTPTTARRTSLMPARPVSRVPCPVIYGTPACSPG